LKHSVYPLFYDKLYDLSLIHALIKNENEKTVTADNGDTAGARSCISESDTASHCNGYGNDTIQIPNLN